MKIQVVSFYAPRVGHEKWIDYLPHLRLQKATAEKFGHRHIVISDQKFSGFETFPVDLPRSLMLAILSGQIAFLKRWDGESPVVLVDADCLIARSLKDAFDGTFDLGLTNREDLRCPINNGAMYIAGNKPKVVEFFERSLAICQKHWGGDQEAISQAAAPVPIGHGVENRDGLRLGFFSMLSHNVVPKAMGVRHKKNPFVVHFKGERKSWMETYARNFIL